MVSGTKGQRFDSSRGHHGRKPSILVMTGIGGLFRAPRVDQISWVQLIWSQGEHLIAHAEDVDSRVAREEALLREPRNG